jgi:hypothetical protein
MNFQRIKWCASAERHLLRAMQDDVELIRQSVEDGISMLWSVNQGESFLITRAEPPDLVVVCYEGFDALEMSKIMLKSAQMNGYRSIRFHTTSRALLRLLRPLNPEPIEYVMRVYTNGRRKERCIDFEHGQHDEHARH